jgi:hypothetical protein
MKIPKITIQVYKISVERSATGSRTEENSMYATTAPAARGTTLGRLWQPGWVADNLLLDTSCIGFYILPDIILQSLLRQQQERGEDVIMLIIFSGVRVDYHTLPAWQGKLAGSNTASELYLLSTYTTARSYLQLLLLCCLQQYLRICRYSHYTLKLQGGPWLYHTYLP